MVQELDDLEASVYALIEQANDRGGKDNVTVILVKVVERMSASVISAPSSVKHGPSARAFTPVVGSGAECRKLRTDAAISTSPERAFGALAVPGYRAYLATFMLTMMADNVEHVVSYWVMHQKFHSPRSEALRWCLTGCRTSCSRWASAP